MELDKSGRGDKIDKYQSAYDLFQFLKIHKFYHHKLKRLASQVLFAHLSVTCRSCYASSKLLEYHLNAGC